MTDGPIILFDAQCVLCSANARFILRHDLQRRFRLAAMQGEAGAALFRRHGVDPADPDTILVVDGDQVLRDSDAVIAIYAGLGWPWRARQARCRAGFATGSIDGLPATGIACLAGGRRAGFQRRRMPVGFYRNRIIQAVSQRGRVGDLNRRLASDLRDTGRGGSFVLLGAGVKTTGFGKKRSFRSGSLNDGV